MNSPKPPPRFDTITGEAWRRSLIAARQRFAGTADRIRSQIPAHHLMPDNTTPPALYSGEIPASEVIAQLKAQLEVAYSLVSTKNDALRQIGSQLHGITSYSENERTMSIAHGLVDEINAHIVITSTDVKQSIAEDTARLDWLESKGTPKQGWIARESTTGRGYRLHQDRLSQWPTPRAAIDAARKASA